MTKTEILKDQILSIAWNLPSDVIRAVADELSSLSSERDVEVFHSITVEEKGQLSLLYDEISRTPFDLETPVTHLEIPVKIKFVVASESCDGDDVSFEPTLHASFDGDTRINVSDLFERNKVLNDYPELKTLWEQKQKAIAEFQDLLKTLSEKYCLDQYVLWSLLRDDL